MNFAIETGDFTLLSQERQDNFEPSNKLKTDSDIAKKELCSYVRNILSQGSLSDLAAKLHIDVSIVISLSNYFETFKALKAYLKQNSYLQEWKYEEHRELIIKVIQDIGVEELEQNLLDRIKIQEEKKQEQKRLEEEHRVELYLKGLAELLEFYGLQNTKENGSFFLRNIEVSNLGCIEEILSFAKETEVEKLTDLDLDKFLLWLASKRRWPTDPDALLGFKIMLPKRPQGIQP